MKVFVRACGSIPCNATNWRSRMGSARRWAALVLSVALVSCAALSQVVKVASEGDHRTLRQRSSDEPPNAPGRPALLILAIDGMGRDFLYSMLAAGDLPEISVLLGQKGTSFPHAYLAPDVVTTLPSTTGVVWATIFTGVPPGEHGFAGNEFFVRETREFAAPIPVSVQAGAEALSVFTEGYAHRFLAVPTIYEVMRERDPSINIWVSMSQFYRGADELLMTRRSVLTKALEAFLAGHTEKNLPRSVWADLDKQDLDVVIERLGQGALPDVLTIYVFGTDDWAHISAEGPDLARTKYMKEVIDPAVGRLRQRLSERNALANRYIVLVSDHGHTEVMKDEAHALWKKEGDDPPAVLQRTGYRVRPFESQVDSSDPFDSVFAYQGAIAYVYLADRSSCAARSTPCNWMRPPRYEEDVLPAADAFYRNNLDGSLAPRLKGTLDLVLTRHPVPIEQNDLAFEVYVGQGITQPIYRYLLEHPHPTYVEVTSRLHDLGTGPHGERAGDILLVAHNGDEARVQDRYYFATPYHSWHGSPSQRDSFIPLIVARPEKPAAEIETLVRSYLQSPARAQDIGALLVGLREGRDRSP